MCSRQLIFDESRRGDWRRRAVSSFLAERCSQRDMIDGTLAMNAAVSTCADSVATACWSAAASGAPLTANPFVASEEVALIGKFTELT